MPPLVPKLPEGTPCYGALARFAGPRELVHGCEKVRDEGYTRWDAHSPFPVHGLDRAMGLRPSVLPWIVLVFGLSGAAGAMALQWWTSASDFSIFGLGQGYPLVISGKPLFSWPAFVPVTFEVGVLFAALAAVIGMLGLNQLPMLYHPLFRSEQFERVSNDSFFISIESWDPKFDPETTAAWLAQIGATHVELVDH